MGQRGGLPVVRDGASEQVAGDQRSRCRPVTAVRIDRFLAGREDPVPGQRSAPTDQSRNPARQQRTLLLVDMLDMNSKRPSGSTSPTPHRDPTTIQDADRSCASP
jgi:hypothetical protein